MCGYGNEHVTDLYEAYFFVNICAKIEEKIVGFMNVHENNPSSSLLVEIKIRYDVYAYLVKYVKKKLHILSINCILVLNPMSHSHIIF
jgi:hypothetical protein